MTTLFAEAPHRGRAGLRRPAPARPRSTTQAATAARTVPECSSTDSPPVWLLDVDGVLNFLDDYPASQWPDTTTFQANGYLMVWSPQMLQRIRKIHDTGLAEVRWLTTWGAGANRYLADKFGLPHLAVVAEPPTHPAYRWWKLPYAQTIYDGGGRLVWTDDDIAHASDAVLWIAQAGPDQVRAISPVGGLLPDHLDRIEDWLTAKNWSDDGQPAT